MESGERRVAKSTPVGSPAKPPTAAFAFAGKLTQPALTLALAAPILAVTRLWDLGSAPAGIVAGEELFVPIVRQIKTGGWIGLSHDLLNGGLAGYAYVLAFWAVVVGDDIGTARLLSGIASLASIGMSYLLVTLLFNRRVGLLTALIMSVGVWPLTYARLALPLSLLLLLELAALYLVFRAFGTAANQSNRVLPLILSGILVGLGLYLDFAAVLFAGTVLCLWLRYYVSGAFDPRVLRERFAAFAIPALIVSLPFWAVVATDSSVRDDANALLITQAPHYREAEGVMGKLRIVTGTVIDAGRALVWSASADDSGQSGGRVVDPLTGLLAVIGLLVCAFHWREDSYGSLLVLLITVAVGVGLTRQDGMFGRLIVGAPVTFSLAGIALQRLLEWGRGRVPGAGVAAFLAVLAAGILLFNLTTYYAHPAGKAPALWTGSAVGRSQAPQISAAPEVRVQPKARRLGVPKRDVAIVSGERSRALAKWKSVGG